MTMFKGVAVSYPKRRKHLNEHSINEVQEPARKTMYDIVMDNFKILNRTTFIHRIIYAGENHFEGEQEDLENIFRSVITSANEAYSAEKLTGFLLCYSKYFIHLVEGDEDSIYMHLRLLQNNEDRIYLGNIKLLSHVSNISRRLTRQWVTYFGLPSQYLGKININSELEESGRHIYNCIRKMYNLVSSYVSDLRDGGRTTSRRLSLFPIDDESPRLSRMRSDTKSIITNASIRNTGIMPSTTTDPYRYTLPEYEIVEFTIKTNFTQTIESYCQVYLNVPQRVIYRDKIWPCPRYSVPFDVFSKPFDCITELPKGYKPEEPYSKIDFDLESTNTILTMQ